MSMSFPSSEELLIVQVVFESNNGTSFDAS